MKVQLFDEATMKLLIDCKLAVYKHLQSANKDVNPEDITVCGAFLPSAKMILKYGDDMFIAERADDIPNIIEVSQLETVSYSIWDVLQ
jgi:hypothetical protein